MPTEKPGSIYYSRWRPPPCRLVGYRYGRHDEPEKPPLDRVPVISIYKIEIGVQLKTRCDNILLTLWSLLWLPPLWRLDGCCGHEPEGRAMVEVCVSCLHLLPKDRVGVSYVR